MKRIIFSCLIFAFLFSNCSSKKKEVDIFQGYFTYMADANIFVSCDEKIKMSVEMKGEEYLILEKKYLKMSDGNGEKVFVRLRGKIKEVAAMEGDGKENALMISEVLEVDENKKCE